MALEYEGLESELARRTRLLSIQQWGEGRATTLIGRHPSICSLLERTVHFAQADTPLLITGDTGTGKELFARAMYLLGPRRRKAFVSVNCAQYADGQLIASELFGHRRGSFTGAVEDHRGVFEEANGGVVFLDEVGDLTLPAQAMLLRVLSEGEVVPVGETRARTVDVRVVAATNRDLRSMVAAGRFREDLYYRLRFLQLYVPPLRERGDDWKLMLNFYLCRLNERSGMRKRFSDEAMRCFAGYAWPGNVRELRGIVETSYHLSPDSVIMPAAMDGLLECRAQPEAEVGSPAAPAEACPGRVSDSIAGMTDGSASFWKLVYEPFMERDLNRDEVRAIVADGLRRSSWSYKRVLDTFGIAPDEYLKFMDFLRHHRLKPER